MARLGVIAPGSVLLSSRHTVVSVDWDRTGGLAIVCSLRVQLDGGILFLFYFRRAADV